MKCPKCTFDNREGVKFCEKCGGEIELVCPNCGTKIPLDRQFCGQCGHDLTKPPEAPPIDYSEPQSYTPKFLADKILTTRGSIEGERKVVTVLFADVANYTSIAEKLDPEEVHQIMDGCFRILMDEIHRYEGTVNQFTGDGIMALFGAPVAHEDHAQRACYAALSIQKALAEYRKMVENDYGVAFKMRIGLNSGPVIVGSIGDDLRMDYSAVGDTTNLAARIQQASKPGQVCISQGTRTIVQDFFQDEPVGKIPLKGKAAPQRIYRVVTDRPGVHTRFEAGLLRGITEFVGRRPEMEVLRAAFERAKEGAAQIVDVVGEAGVGKSRLIYEFSQVLGSETSFLTGFCIHYGRNINFLPVIHLLKADFGIEEGMTEEAVGNRIAEKATDNLAAKIPFYRSLLSLKVDDPQFNTLDPEGRKFGAFEAVEDLLLAQSEERPLVIFLEDAHWMDKISEEFFTYFSRCILEHPILMLAAYRPEGSPPWAQGAHYQRLGLDTLSSKFSIRIVRNMLGGLALDPELGKKIAKKAGGNPFFIEEIVKELREGGHLVKAGHRYLSTRPIHQLEIPNTIQGVLAARMDRLSEDLKRTMQAASVIGRDFTFRILEYITELGKELKTHLGNLVGLEILYEKVLYPELKYIFKHALTQEVAYNSLLKQRRQEIHGRIAQAIEELYAGRLEEHYEMLGHHYERSGNAKKAVNYLVLAGEKSNKNLAVQSASGFFNKALEVVESKGIALDPETEVRLHHGQAVANFGIGATDLAKEGFSKAIEVSRQHGMIDYEKKSLWGQRHFVFMWPVHIEAERIFKDGIARAREMQDKALEGVFLSSMANRVSVYDDPYRAYQIDTDAKRAVMESGDPGAVFYVNIGRAFRERWLGRPEKTIELTEGAIEALSKMSLLNPLVFCSYCRGVALAEVGRIEEAMAVIRYGIDACEKFGAAWRIAALYNSLGYCYSEIHQPERAWSFNLKSEETCRKMMEQHPMGILDYAEMLSQASVNLMENLFDQRKLREAWDRVKAHEEESKSEDYDFARLYWQLRMNYLAAQILLRRNDPDQAEMVIQENLERARKKHVRKREGAFLRLLGELQIRRNESDKAIRNMSEAILILKEVGNPRQLWHAHASLASAFDKVGRSSEARGQWGAAAEVIRSLANGLSDRELREGFLQAEPIREILSKAGA